MGYSSSAPSGQRNFFLVQRLWIFGIFIGNFYFSELPVVPFIEFIDSYYLLEILNTDFY